jgi:hypothetical protein
LPAGEKIFTSSGTFTVPDGVTKIDVFCVGGGGAGGQPYLYATFEYRATSGVYYISNVCRSGRGGSGGYTATVKNASVTPGQSIAVAVGAGGTCDNILMGNKLYCSTAISGGISSAGPYNAYGGDSGGVPVHNDDYTGRYALNAGLGILLTKGGSGGGVGALYNTGSYLVPYGSGSFPNNITEGAGGSDGSTCVGYFLYDDYLKSYVYTEYSYGQGTTTRYFGESNGTLYAGGGGGGSVILAYDNSNPKPAVTYNNSIGYVYYNAGGAGGGANGGRCTFVAESNTAPSASVNTGGGGGGSVTYFNTRYGCNNYAYGCYAGNGGSGICIIRWAAQ